jgi:hypothetical protein
MKNAQENTGSAGFSLVEVIMSLTLSLIILASIVSTFIVFAAGSKSVGAYTEMSQQSRKLLEAFSRDIRAAEDVSTATATNVVVTYPENAFYDGMSVQYIFDELIGVFSRIERDRDGNLNSNKVLLDGVDQFSFGYFSPLGTALAYDQASLLLSVKSVRVDAEMVRSISQTDATDYIISARFMMRNRAVTK